MAPWSGYPPHPEEASAVVLVSPFGVRVPARWDGAGHYRATVGGKDHVIPTAFAARGFAGVELASDPPRPLAEVCGVTDLPGHYLPAGSTQLDSDAELFLALSFEPGWGIRLDGRVWRGEEVVRIIREHAQREGNGA